MRKALLVTGILTIMIVTIVSCSKSSDGSNSCDGVAKTWSANVSVIIQTFCNQAGCHNAGSMQGPGPLTNYAEVFPNRASIREAVKLGVMPQNTTLTAAQKNAVICWIDSGAPNN
ncbi:MAG TPA: hypothetical protein VF487_11835 [Chitinophagaceae bacterium]